MSLAGRSVIVTGASQGAGFIFAEALLARGALVVLSDEGEEALAEASAPLLAQYPHSARFFVADPADRLDMSNLMSFTIDAFDRLDIMINDARVVMEGDILDPEDESLPEMFVENVLAAQKITNAFLRRYLRLKKSRGQQGPGAQILHLVSNAQGRRRAGMAGFAISSAAVAEFVDVLAPPLAAQGIKMARIELASLPAEAPYEGQVEELIAQLLAVIEA